MSTSLASQPALSAILPYSACLVCTHYKHACSVKVDSLLNDSSFTRKSDFALSVQVY
jgi:hypothetical protein